MNQKWKALLIWPGTRRVFDTLYAHEAGKTDDGYGSGLTRARYIDNLLRLELARQNLEVPPKKR